MRIIDTHKMPYFPPAAAETVRIAPQKVLCNSNSPSGFGGGSGNNYNTDPDD